jgi:hypothetical protein
LNGSVAAGGSFLDVGGIIADFVEPIAIHEYRTFFDDQNVVALQEKCHALAGLGDGGVTE